MAAFLRKVRIFEDLFDDRTLPRPTGLAFSARANRFLTIADTQPSSINVVPVTPAEDLVPRSAVAIADKPTNLLNSTFDNRFNRLLLLSNSNQLVAIAADANGQLIAGSRSEFNLSRLGIKNPQGLTVDPNSGAVFVLDRDANQIVKLTPTANGSFDQASVSTIALGGVSRPDIQSLALDPTSGHLYLLSPSRKELYEVQQNGSLVETRSLDGLGLRNPQSITFAPSGDTTDNPQAVSLYVADSSPTSAGITELSLTATVEATAVTSISLVRIIDTSKYPTPSPDPSGIAYVPATNSLLISDGEVEEIGSVFQGKNLYTTALSGTLNQTGSTTSYSNEPTGVAIDPVTGNAFFTDDDLKRVFEVDPGNDGIHGTADDSIVRQFSTSAFGSGDPEGIAYDSASNNLFIADGINSEIYRISRTGTLISQFDTAVSGIRDPEGIEYNPATGTLFVVGQPVNVLAEFSTSGTLINTFNISSANPVQPAGLAIGPSSNNPNGTSIYISDRGVDNFYEPNENDGKVYEFAFAAAPPPTSAKYYLSSVGTSQISASFNGGSQLSYADEDILLYDAANPGKPWSLYFDGSDVGLGGSGVDLNAFDIQSDGSILMSFNTAMTLAGSLTVSGAALSVTASDIVRFIPTSTGSNTAGKYELYFQGANVGLSTSSEKIDVIDVLDDGSLVISTTGNVSVTNVSGTDEDLLQFAPTSLGDNTSGTWTLYFDGSDVGLSEASSEDINAAWIDQSTNPAQVYLTTLGSYSVPGLSGNGNDILKFASNSLGSNTSGTYSLVWDGDAAGFKTAIDGMTLVPA